MSSTIRQRRRSGPTRDASFRAAAGLAVALLAMGSAPGGAQSGDANAEFVAASEPCLNLRPGPSRDDAPVRCLPPGRRMTLLESQGEWGRVRLPDDQIGWVALRLMKPLAEGAAAPAPAAPKSEPPRPRQDQPRQPEPEKEVVQKPGAEREASMTALAEAEAASRRRVRELEEALVAADAESRELERALAAVIADDAESTATDEAKWQEEVDDLTGLLRAAEMFLSESEKQRLELARQVAALQEENQALRARLGEEPVAAPPAAGFEAVEGEAGVLLPEAPIAALPTPPESPPAEEPDTGELMKTVNEWAKAWSEQRVEDYLALYGATFQPPGGMSRADWEAQRRQRISAPSQIEVKVAFRDVRPEGPDRTEIEFLQSYKSDAYSDFVVKTLTLVLESGRWVIADERTTP